MNNDTLVKELEAKRQSLRILYLFYIAGCLAAVIFFFIDPRIMVIIGAAAVLLYVLVVRRQNKAYSRLYGHSNLLYSMRQVVDNPTHQHLGGFERQHIEDSWLIPSQLGKGCLSREYMTAEKDGMQIEAADISTHYFIKRENKQNVVWVNGCMTRVKLPWSTELNLWLVDRELASENLQKQFYVDLHGLSVISTGDESLNEKFIAYSPLKESALPYRAIQKINELKQYTTGCISMRINGDTLDILITGRFLTLNYSAKDEVSVEKLAFNPFPELRNILDIARSLHK